MDLLMQVRLEKASALLCPQAQLAQRRWFFGKENLWICTEL